MSDTFYALALLACPVGMGAMMWFMMRGSNHGSQSKAASGDDEITRLRAEVDQLRAAQREGTETGGTPGADPMGPW